MITFMRGQIKFQLTINELNGVKATEGGIGMSKEEWVSKKNSHRLKDAAEGQKGTTKTSSTAKDRWWIKNSHWSKRVIKYKLRKESTAKSFNQWPRFLTAIQFKIVAPQWSM